MSFTKLFSSITDSTIWDGPHHVRIVWITLLAMCDRHGIVQASVPGLAHRARVTLQEVQQALEAFLAPDEYSRTQEHEGRRIAVCEGGWQLLNYAKYRAIQSAESVRESKREWAARRRESTQCLPTSTLDDPLRTTSTQCLSSASVSDQVLDQDPDPTHASTRPVYRNLDGWSPSEALYAEAVIAGLSRAQVDQRITELRNGPIGGARGVFDRDDYVRSLLPKWKVWQQTASASAVHRPGSTFGARGGVGKGGAFGPVLEPRSKHVRIAQQHGIDLGPIIASIREQQIVEKLGTDAFHEYLEKGLAKELKRKVDAGEIAPPKRRQASP